MKWLVIILLPVGGCSYYAFTHHRVCTQQEVIEEVGGCASSGQCGVRYRSGRVGEQYKPVTGELVCTESEMRPNTEVN